MCIIFVSHLYYVSIAHLFLVFTDSVNTPNSRCVVLVSCVALVLVCVLLVVLLLLVRNVQVVVILRVQWHCCAVITISLLLQHPSRRAVVSTMLHGEWCRRRQCLQPGNISTTSGARRRCGEEH